MPKLKRQAQETDGLVELILGSAKRQGVSQEALAGMVGISVNTLRRRMQHPEEITVRELRCWRRGLDISKEKFCKALPI